MMDDVLRALAEPKRRAILRLIQSAELSSGEIASHFEVSRAAVSQHLQILTSAGLASVRRQGTRRLYRARPEGLQEVRGYLDEFWSSSLQRLKQAAEAEELERN